MAQAALILAATAYSSYSQYQAGKGQEAIAKRNASLLDKQAESVEARGAQEELAIRRKVRGLVGRQRAAAAASGVDVSTGSAYDLQVETEALGEMDLAQLRTNTALEAWGVRTQASNERFSGSQMRRQGNAQATSTLIGGMADAYPSYSAWNGARAPKK